jgi:hypothetical protein
MHETDGFDDRRVHAFSILRAGVIAKWNVEKCQREHLALKRERSTAGLRKPPPMEINGGLLSRSRRWWMKASFR